MGQCPSCARLIESRILCPECGSPTGSDLDYFAAIGLPRTLQIDPVCLEETYHDLGRRIHPDRFASSPVKLRDASLRATALLTRSYRTLRDPISRGLYALELAGVKLADNNKNVPPEFAELVFDVQDQLVSLKAARARGGQVAHNLNAEVKARRDQLQDAMDALMDQLNARFSALDADDGSGRDELLQALKSVLSNIAYLRTLLRDVDKELDTAQAA
jgi:molecular chaperone HscB